MAELKTFLFTDICRSVDLKNEMTGRSMTERDQAFIQTILTPHRQRIVEHLEEHGGRIVSTAGDGHFLVFDNTIQAAQWAIDVQESHRDDPIVTPGGGHVEVRISVHVGVPQIDPADPDNFVGKTVDYASRLNDYANGGQILVSRSVMAILEDVGLDGISLHLHGRRQLKGIGRVEVHELVYEEKTGPREMRQHPSTHHSDRQWTVLPTALFDEPAGSIGELPEGSDMMLASPPLRRVGNYELEELLGSGGMGDVYKARHIQFDRVRAVKVIKPQFVASGHMDVISRFYHEIKVIGALEHKNIVVAIDSSSPSDRIHYLVMEYIDGVGLQELVEQHGPLDVPDACEAIRQAARGLGYIHRNNMVHRDIKPSNLMLTLVEGDDLTSVPGSDSSVVPESLYGVVKILDLGLALLVADREERLTRYDNKAMGTGMYMSPEQWKTSSVDIRADIYSLGCTLYHLLSGNPPFYDSDLRPEKAHEKSRIPPIQSGSQIPRRLWDVIRKMMAKRAEDRYATPNEVATALAPFTDGHNLVDLVQGYCEADRVMEHQAPTHPGMSTRQDTRSKASSTFASKLAARPSRRVVMWGLMVLLAGLIGFGGFFIIRRVQSQPYVDLRNHLGVMPGLNGGWWFHEVPWYTPYARQRLMGSIRSLKSEPGGMTLDQLSELFYSEQVARFYKQLRVIVDSQSEMSEDHPGDGVRQRVSQQIYEAMLARGKPSSRDYEKGLDAALDSLTKLENDGQANGADLHLMAVLNHDLARWELASQYYFKAMEAYGVKSRLHPLVMNDHARMLLDSNHYDEAMQSFRREAHDPASPHWAVLAGCLEAEAAYRRPGASSDPSLEQSRRIMEGLWKSSQLPSNHPLHAYLYERQGWILNEAWRFHEGLAAFERSENIVTMQMGFPEDPNPYLAELDIWARQGEATAANFSRGTDAAATIYHRLVDEIDATLNNRSDAPERFKRLSMSQRQQMRERLPSVCLRLGDCYLLAPQPDYPEAAKWYRRSVIECEDLRWEQADRRANFVIDWRYKRCLPAALAGDKAEAENLFADAQKKEDEYIERQKKQQEKPSTSFQFSKTMVRALIDMQSDLEAERARGIDTLMKQVMETETADLGRHRLGTFVLAVEQLALSDMKTEATRLRELASHVKDVFVVYRKTPDELELLPFLKRCISALEHSLQELYESTGDVEIQRQLKDIREQLLR